MTTSVLDDENAHVKELNRLFLSCAKNGDKHLDASGLQDLCVKLNLSSFADVILERVLTGCTVVDFSIFKERFVQLLPDIVNVTTVTESLESNAEKSLSELGIEPGGFFNRYEARILCENTPELNSLQLVEINELFDQADSSRIGRITLAQFLAQYQIQKRLSEEVNFITETFVPSVNLFEALDPSNTGTVSCQELLEHWLACGISIEQGLYVLKHSGHPLEGTINAVSLSGSLERELGDLAAAPTASTVIRVALLSLHAFIDHLRCSLKEAELRAEHFYKQLQLANQRHVLLIEELEQNQISIEQAYEQRFRDSDERNRTRMNQMEERFMQEKKDLLNELEKEEEELCRLRQNESSCRTQLQLVERQYARVIDEVKELSETVQQLEQMNRHLRSELNKALQPRPMEESQPTVMLRHRIELLIAHNKRLREKIDELTNNEKKHGRLKKVEPLYFRWTSAFRLQLLALKRRREAKDDSLSEMESEPESIFVKARRRRFLKIKDRKRRHERVARFVGNSSSSESVGTAGKAMGESMTSDKSQMDSAPTKKAKHCGSENPDTDTIERLKEQHRKEIAALKHSASKALADALNDQQRQILQSFEKERRQFEITLASERNTLERKFTEEKMKVIDLLQEQFGCEVNRLKAALGASASASDELGLHVEQGNNGESSLSERSRNKRGGFVLHGYAQSSGIETSKSNVALRNFRHCGRSRNVYHLNEDSELLNIEKTTPAPLSLKTYSRNVWLAQSKCAHYEMIKTKLKQIQAVFVDGNIIESGFEDVVSSADSISEEKAQLKNEIKRLNSRLNLAREKIVELRAYLSAIQNTTSWGMARCSSGCLGSSERLGIGGPVDDCAATWCSGHGLSFNGSSNGSSKLEQLRAENVLLNARLTESAELVKMLVREYNNQLNKTSRLGKLIRTIYSIDEEKV